MNRIEFVAYYLRSAPLKICVHFDVPAFLADDGILIARHATPFQELLRYNTPWHQKGGAICGRIETVRDDPEYRSIRLQDVSQFREKLESIQGGPAVAPSYLWDVPVATDTLLDESLILDSNRTLVRLLRESNDFDFTVPVVEIRGENMGRIVPDFEILARRP